MSEPLPHARVRHRGWMSIVVWIVPLVAAVVAGFLVWQRLQEYGPTITIKFKDGAGLRAGQTAIKYRGVPVGEVTSIDLSNDEQYVLVRARMRHSARQLARDGSTFWIVRPEVGIGNVTGLGTVITGPEIEALPGKGTQAKREFAGLEHAPVAMGANGIKVILKAERPRSIRPHTPVLYRGVEVGVVQSVGLSSNASAAEVQVLIWERYAALVRTGSAFWNASGASLKGGIFRGVEVDVESLRALVTGGVEFASPEHSPRAKSGTVFFLHDAPQKEWLAWNLHVPIARQDSEPSASAGRSSKAVPSGKRR